MASVFQAHEAALDRIGPAARREAAKALARVGRGADSDVIVSREARAALESIGP
jgi:hypothetical protein